MKYLILLFILASNLTFAQTFKDVLEKKITIIDGKYDLNYFANLIQKEFGLKVIFEQGKEFTFDFTGVKEKPIRLILSPLLNTYRMEIIYEETSKSFLIKFFPKEELKSENIKKPLEKISIALEDVSLIDTLETLKELFKKDFSIENKEKERIKITCNLEVLNLKEFLEYLAKKYNIFYEEKDNKIIFK